VAGLEGSSKLTVTLTDPGVMTRAELAAEVMRTGVLTLAKEGAGAVIVP
jgi:hypothetical protein